MLGIYGTIHIIHIVSDKYSDPLEDIKALFTLFSYHWFTMCSFYERESPEWLVKEDVVWGDTE